MQGTIIGRRQCNTDNNEKIAGKVDFDNFTRWSTKTALKIENSLPIFFVGPSRP